MIRKNIKNIEINEFNIKKPVFILLSFIFIIILIFGSFFIVPAGHRGVIFNFVGGVKLINYDEGFHFKIPLLEKATKFEVRTKVYNEDASAASKDLQIVSTKVALNYHLDKEQVYNLFKNIGINYESRIINPSIQEVVKAITAKHIAEELITKREVVKEEIKIALQERLLMYYIVVDDMSITNFDFSVEFNKAIESKVSAEQNALKEQNNLKVVEFQAQQKVVEAKGQAEAIKIINEQLKSSPQYVSYITIQKWDGKMPLALGSGSLLSITSENK